MLLLSVNFLNEKSGLSSEDETIKYLYDSSLEEETAQVQQEEKLAEKLVVVKNKKEDNIDNNNLRKEGKLSREHPDNKVTKKIEWKNANEVGVEPSFQVSVMSVDEPIETMKITKDLVLSPKHYVFQKGSWDGSPIVIKKFKLIFFTTPKVGCSVMKQLFRRMMGYKNWSAHDDALPHDPFRNGLTYLHHFSLVDAKHMLTSTEWTRAMLVREPKHRALSAYLDKGKKVNNGKTYVEMRCCRKFKKCTNIARSSFKGFLQVARNCRDPHWAPQSNRIEGRYWPYINFIGHLENAKDDVKYLLKKVGAWDEYGANGWGKNGDEPIFSSTGTVKHATGSNESYDHYFDEETHAMVEDFYAKDYNNKLFEF